MKPGPKPLPLETVKATTKDVQIICPCGRAVFGPLDMLEFYGWTQCPLMCRECTRKRGRA